MGRDPSATPRMIQSPQLSLYSATADLIAKDIEGREALAAALGVHVPESWPPDLYGPGAMRFALAQLSEAPEQGWSFWYLATREEPVELAGLCGFKGRPDAAGSVEIGYSILGCYQRRGFATEAVGRLLGWAFSHHNVNEVCAETLPHLRQSIRVLEKNGFRRAGAGSEKGVIRFAVQRAWLK
ncbi:MAG: GNAT family N-acetyltransferase [Xanthomonadales bacterium]|nr:GNAT family N-acetyltransferase [Xanthomonadales bacterium]